MNGCDYESDYSDSMYSLFGSPAKRKVRLPPDPKKNPFKVGDIVRRVNGSAPIEVNSSTSEYIYGNYVRSAHGVHCEHYSKFTYYNEDHKGEVTMATQNTLYEIKQDGKTTFGTKLAVNSAGQWVMEEKGTGLTVVVDKANVEEVMPYTVDVTFKDGSQAYSFTSEKGKFNKGDVLLLESKFEGFSIALVTAVDTKAKSATKELKPLAKLVVDTNI